MLASEKLNFSGRRQAVFSQFQASLKSPGGAAFITTALPNVRYLSGFTGSNGAVLLTEAGAVLFTDPRYALQAPAESDCKVKIVKGPLLVSVKAALTKSGTRTVGFERNRLGYVEYEMLASLSDAKTAVRRSRLTLHPTVDLVEIARSVKSEEEIEAIRHSVGVNSRALDASLRKIRPGQTREDELAAEIDYQMRKLGASGPSFDTIVAAGSRTALPHAHPTAEKIPCSELLLIDMGATVAGYASDMTRTYATGELRGKQRQMYKAVLQSQLAAIDAIRPGVSAAAVDRAARSVLREYGWEKLFIHSTGHGLGLEIHERPRVGRKDRTKLEAGMVITVEPGIYLEGFGGIRIEDTVLVTKSGPEVLTPTDKHWQVL